MMCSNLSTPLKIWGLLLCLPLVGISALSAKEPNPYLDIPSLYGDAVVTVRFLAQVTMPGVNQEVEGEAHCLMIEASGTILCSNAEVGGFFQVMARLLGRSEDPISTRPRDLRAQIEGDEHEWSARLIARDSDRDLAWVLLEDVPKTKTFKYVDFSDAALPEIGDEAYTLRRLTEFLGSSAVVSELAIAARLQRPRPLFLASRSLGDLGMPAFDRQGKVIGVLVAQAPREGEGSPAMQSQTLPGQRGIVDDLIGRLILPASEVVKATRLAKETWKADQSETLQ